MIQLSKRLASAAYIIPSQTRSRLLVSCFRHLLTGMLPAKLLPKEWLLSSTSPLCYIARSEVGT